MKTHINQILTVVSFFSMSLTTTLVISWGMNGFVIDETKKHEICPQKQAVTIQAKEPKLFNLKISDGMKVFIPKNTLKING